MDTQKVERVYTGYARVYNRIFGTIFQRSREAAIRDLDVKPGERVLEIGVGTGLCLPLYPRHCRVTGIDLSDGMLDRARELVRARHLDNVELRRMDAGALEFADGSFDTVVAAYVVTAVPDHRKVMSEAIRVCRPGGRIMLLNHFTNDKKLIAAFEKAISPLCKHIGFRTDLSVADVLDGWPIIMQRHERVNPLQMWHIVECINAKAPNPEPAVR
ncbi:MAG TPA: methyltransferase domain-containing protein [Burkholderiales bacterium]|jgi:phosphatidylethanolamine/phosphatidyl-N-methylethanolamine N-methyltransferase|nr:methyltransferase domain-containing protein [Burkholderiales bacterium]